MSFDYTHNTAAMPPQGINENPKKRSGLKVVLLLAVTLGVLAISAIAAAALLLPKTPQPQDVLPESTLALVVLDADPSVAQKVNLVRFAQALPSDKLDSFDEADPIGSLISDQKTQTRWEQVQPWLGKKFAVALVPDANADPAPLVAVQVNDEQLARPWLDSQLEELLVEFGLAEPGEPIEYAFRDGYALISTNAYVVQQAAVAEQTLSQSEQFAADRDLLGDQIAWGWFDATSTLPLLRDPAADDMATAFFQDIGDDLLFDIEGRYMFGVSAQPDDLEVTFLSQGARIPAWSGAEDLTFVNNSTVTDQMPRGTIAAVGTGGVQIPASIVETLLNNSLGDTSDISSYQQAAETGISLYVLMGTPSGTENDLVMVSDDLVILARVDATDSDQLLTLGTEVDLTEADLYTNGPYAWAGVSFAGGILSPEDLARLSQPGDAQDSGASVPEGGLVTLIDYRAAVDAGILPFDIDSSNGPVVSSLAVSTGPNPGDARIVSRTSVGMLVSLLDFNQNLSRASSESTLNSVAEAVVRNANAIAASTMSGGGFVRQTDLDIALLEALGDPLPQGYGVTDTGVADEPSVTITYNADGYTCAVTIGKVNPQDDQVLVTVPADCS